MKKLIIAILTAILLSGTAVASPLVVTKPLPDPVPGGCDMKDDDTPLFCLDSEHIHIEYLNSDNPTANRVVNTAINKFISSDLAAQTNSADGIPADAEYHAAVAQYVRENSTSFSPANLNIGVGQLPSYCGLSQYSVDIEFYSAGASVGTEVWRFVFDGNQQITPDTLLIADKRVEFERQIEDATYRFLLEYSADEDRPDFGLQRNERNKTITPYLYLAPEGLHLQYQPYDLLPGIYGAPDLTLPWQWLDGIINPRFTPEHCHRS